VRIAQPKSASIENQRLERSGTFVPVKGCSSKEHFDEQRHQQTEPRSEDDTFTSAALDVVDWYPCDYRGRGPHLELLAAAQRSKF
jgi:hypothetical protein